jgi:hypothetical protein
VRLATSAERVGPVGFIPQIIYFQFVLGLFLNSVLPRVRVRSGTWQRFAKCSTKDTRQRVVCRLTVVECYTRQKRLSSAHQVSHSDLSPLLDGRPPLAATLYHRFALHPLLFSGRAPLPTSLTQVAVPTLSGSTGGMRPNFA